MPCSAHVLTRSRDRRRGEGSPIPLRGCEVQSAGNLAEELKDASPPQREPVVIQPHGVPSEGMRRIRLSSDDRRVGLGRAPRLRFAVVVAAAVAALAIIGHCVPMRAAASPSPSAPRQPVASLPLAVHASADQSQLAQERPICKGSKVFAIDAIPAAVMTALVVLSAGLATLAGMGWQTQLVAPAGRSPPHPPVAVLSGQDLLTRIRVARR